MKIYSRVLGILTFLIAICFLGLLIYVIVFEANESSEKLLSLIGLIPIYIVMHFVIIHRFGFNFNVEYTTKESRSILITSLLLFGVLISFIAWQISDVVALSKKEEMEKKESEELYSYLSKLRTYDKQMTAYGFEGELQTKLTSENSLLYKLKISSKKPFNPENVTFTIEFHDKDGFLILSHKVEDYSRVADGDKIIGIVSNSKIDQWALLKKFATTDNDEKEVPKVVESIANWRLLVSIE
jgi:hypothetical protein